MKKRIHFFHFSAFPHHVSTTYGNLRAFCEQFSEIRENYDWCEPHFLIDKKSAVFEEINDGDVIGMSCFLWNFNLHLSLARKIKNRHPNCLIILGGPQIPLQGKELLSKHPYLDFLVYDEGEISLKNILSQHTKTKPCWDNIKGISYRQDGQIFQNGPPDLLPDNLDFPSPFTNKLYENSAKILASHRMPVFWSWEVIRSCHFRCTYCTKQCTGKIRHFSLKRLYEEIDYFCENPLVYHISIFSDVFGLFASDLELIRYFVERSKELKSPKNLMIRTYSPQTPYAVEIARLLYENNMTLGVRMGFHSLNPLSRKAVKRHDTLEELHETKVKINEYGIPSYALIYSGFPEETKESYMKGICELLRRGHHDDIKNQDLLIAPEAPINHPEFIKKYGLKYALVPIDLHRNRDPEEIEYVNMVVGSNTLSFDDWVECLLFYFSVRSLHQGAYTKFISKYLSEFNLLEYEDFYIGLMHYFLSDPESPIGQIFGRVKKLTIDYGTTSKIAFHQRIESQADMIGQMNKYTDGREVVCDADRYMWLCFSDHFDQLFDGVDAFLKAHKQLVKKYDLIQDLLKYQKDIMIRPEYDPKTGKSCSYFYNWFEYFQQKATLKQQNNILHYADTHLGPQTPYPLIKDDLKAFSKAVIGGAWLFTSSKRFYHQPEYTTVQYDKIEQK